MLTGARSKLLCTAVLALAALSAPADSASDRDVSFLVHKELYQWHHVQSYDCNQKIPSGESTCKAVEIVAQQDLPIFADDKKKGVKQRLSARFKFDLYKDGIWTETDSQPVAFLLNKEGWSSASSSSLPTTPKVPASSRHSTVLDNSQPKVDVLSLVHRELFEWHHTQDYDCNKKTPRGGSICRGLEIVTRREVPISKSDKLNGISRYIFVRFRFALYKEGKWAETINIPIDFLYGKDGWNSAMAD